MAKNRLGDGVLRDFVAAAAHTSGELFALGEVVGVVQGDAAIGEWAVLDTAGIYEVVLTAGAPSDGDPLYYDATAPGTVTATPAAGDIFAGWAASKRGVTPAAGSVLIALSGGEHFVGP